MHRGVRWRPGWAARLEPRLPPVLSAGERIHAAVLCTNVGSRTWTPATDLALFYHLRTREGAILCDGERMPVSHDVPPGASVELHATLAAPDAAGEYLVDWVLGAEREGRLPGDGCAPACVPLRVTPFAHVEPGRYPVEAVPRSSGPLRFGKAAADVRVAVAVRAWNVLRHGRRALLDATLDSLAAAGHPFELFLVDNGSTDGTAALIGAMGGHAAPRLPGGNPAGHGMNLAIERALSCAPDLVVFSDDDVAWRPGFLRRLVDFWAHAPADVALLAGFLEPRWPWNTIRGALDCGGVRAIVRETAPGGAWTFPAAHWRWIGPLPGAMEADAMACHRLRRAGFRLAQADLATHRGAGRSTWGNEPPPGEPLDALFFHPVPSIG